jgi:surface polysaccharide O-acyltransferase-like enzyme
MTKTAAGQEMHDIVLSIEFWNNIEDCLRASAPLFIVLRGCLFELFVTFVK